MRGNLRKQLVKPIQFGESVASTLMRPAIAEIGKPVRPIAPKATQSAAVGCRLPAMGKHCSLQAVRASPKREVIILLSMPEEAPSRGNPEESNCRKRIPAKCSLSHFVTNFLPDG
jgi:hypothetical protein